MALKRTTFLKRRLNWWNGFYLLTKRRTVGGVIHEHDPLWWILDEAYEPIIMEDGRQIIKEA